MRLMFLLLLSSPAFAGEIFARDYSSKHLEAHPRQTVRSLTVDVLREEGSVYLNVRADVRGRSYEAFMLCDPHPGGYSCAVECDGGQADLAWDGGASMLFINKGFQLSGTCGEGEEFWLEPTEGGDDVFELIRSEE